MEDKKNSFLVGLCITLGTIIIGLVSLMLFSNLGPQEPKRCEYNGWAYANGEIYESENECNTCFCNSGETICTEEICTEDINENPEGETCIYDGVTYREGDSFKSTDGCNFCGCNKGGVACTLMACED